MKARNGSANVRCAMTIAVRLCISPASRNMPNSGSSRMIGGSIWLARTPSRSTGPPVLNRAKA